MNALRVGDLFAIDGDDVLARLNACVRLIARARVEGLFHQDPRAGIGRIGHDPQSRRVLARPATPVAAQVGRVEFADQPAHEVDEVLDDERSGHMGQVPL